jgi:bifunctional non-homologous end joining protein LigD
MAPERIEPMLAMAAEELPVGPGWLHERKYDGVRIGSPLRAGRPSLLTRMGHHKGRQFPEVTAALTALHGLVGHDLYLDGEIVDAESDDFIGLQRIQRRLGLQKEFDIRLRAEASPAAFVAFDVLAVGAFDLTGKPLAERRAVLETILSAPPPGVRLGIQSPDGDALLKQARLEEWEGIVSKRADSRYRAGERGPYWRKLKLMQRQEFVVGGFTHSEADRSFAALVVGYHAGDQLMYAGRVGSGFSEEELRAIGRRLGSSARPDCPFAQPPDLEEPVTWVHPRLVAEVRYQGWTETDRLRCPSYLVMRDDKRPADVTRAP